MTIQLRDMAANQIKFMVDCFWSDLRIFAKLTVEIFNKLNPTLELHSGYFLVKTFSDMNNEIKLTVEKKSEEHLYYS